MKAAVLLSLLAFLGASVAHPGEDHRVEALERRMSLELIGKRSLAHCRDTLAARGVPARNQERRRAFLEEAFAHARLGKRDFASVLAKNHKSNLTGITPETDAAELFKGGENVCTLSPETTEGPYFVQGEMIRKDVRDNQPGVPLYVDIQLIDTNTCAPLPGAALDFWHANATGVYSGVSAAGNGVSDADTSNLDTTFGRGIQETSADGVAQFQTIFPGHYTGRTTHIHIMSHSPGKWTQLANGTISGNTLNSHVGQLYFDAALIDAVEKLAPYNTNQQPLTTNVEDFLMAMGAENVDPVMEYVLLGDRLEDGVFAWVSVAVNATTEYVAHAAVNLTAEGGVENPRTGGPGGPGGPDGPGGPCGSPGGRGPPPGMRSNGGPGSFAGGPNGSAPGGPGGPGGRGPPPGFQCDTNTTEGGEGGTPPSGVQILPMPTGSDAVVPSGPSPSGIAPSPTPSASEGEASAVPSAGPGGEGQEGEDCGCDEGAVIGGKPGKPEHGGKPPGRGPGGRPGRPGKGHGEKGHKGKKHGHGHGSDSDSDSDSDDDSDDDDRWD